MKVYGALEVAQLEWFTNAGKPSAANYFYRVIWVSDIKQVQVSDGTQWVSVGTGASGSLSWVEGENSPIPALDSNIQIYAFSSGLSQKLYALIRVPSSYTAGNQIKIKLTFYSPDSSGTALISSVSTLIRPGTDVISSTTNQYSSANSAVTLSAPTVNIPQALSLNLTSSTGTVNSVSVSALDFLQVQLTRGTDTSTSDINVPVYGAEVSFG